MISEKNNEGLSPLELAFRYGSVRFVRQVLEEEGFIRQTTLFVDKHTAWYKGASIDDSKICNLHIVQFLLEESFQSIKISQ